MKIAVIGGGINGLFIAWRLCDAGFGVELHDSGRVLGQTSSASSKLLHGGIRYLEHGRLTLVREALIDRQWWLDNCPEYANAIEINMPVFAKSPRSAALLFIGAVLYKLLAGRRSLGPVRWFGRAKTKVRCPEIESVGLSGSVSFFDAQMNEESLGNWVRWKAEESGVGVFENSKISYVTRDAEVHGEQFGVKQFDFVVNACGPWASKLVRGSEIDSDFDLTMVRGSHIFIDQKISRPYLFQESEGSRVVFVLPYQGSTLVGTTEVAQSLSDPIECSEDERTYLLSIYNNNFTEKISSSNVQSEYSGLRPIVTSSDGERNLSAASRESKIETIDSLINIYGGKWTSAPSLSKKVLSQVEKLRSNK